MMSMIAATIVSFGIEGSCYTTKISLPKMSSLGSFQRPTLHMDAPPLLTFVCPRVCLSLLSGCSLVWLYAYRRAVGPCPTTYHRCWGSASFWVHSRRCAAYHSADWAVNLGQSPEATLGAHTLITPLDLNVHLKFRYQIRDLVMHDNFRWGGGM